MFDFNACAVFAYKVEGGYLSWQRMQQKPRVCPLAFLICKRPRLLQPLLVHPGIGRPALQVQGSRTAIYS